MKIILPTLEKGLDEVIILTLEEYNELSEEEKNNGKFYCTVEE